MNYPNWLCRIFLIPPEPEPIRHPVYVVDLQIGANTDEVRSLMVGETLNAIEIQSVEFGHPNGGKTDLRVESRIPIKIRKIEEI